VARSALLGVAASTLCLVAVLVCAVQHGSSRSEMLEFVEVPAGAEIVDIPRSALLRQRALRGMALAGGYRATQTEEGGNPVDDMVTKDNWVGRCRCVGQGQTDTRVVCACTGPDDLWRKGPYEVVTGYTVIYDKHEEDFRDWGKYLTVVAQGFPDGPKKDPHYYLLVQPWDDFGKATMEDFYPDASLGVPQDGFFMFETTGSNYPAFRSDAVGSMLAEDRRYAGHFETPKELVKALPQFAHMFAAK
jgi:hypothetical protein